MNSEKHWKWPRLCRKLQLFPWRQPGRGPTDRCESCEIGEEGAGVRRRGPLSLAAGLRGCSQGFLQQVAGPCPHSAGLGTRQAGATGQQRASPGEGVPPSPPPPAPGAAAEAWKLTGTLGRRAAAGRSPPASGSARPGRGAASPRWRERGAGPGPAGKARTAPRRRGGSRRPAIGPAGRPIPKGRGRRRGQ